MNELAVGTTFAGHRIDAFAGRGGMGVVYRATQLALDRTVALKVISPVLVGDRSIRQRFLHECKLAASLEHPNVIPIYYTGEDSGVAFIAMRYVNGDDLRSLLRRQGSLDALRAAKIVAQIAAALDAAHAAGLVHRDVKPANVLLDLADHVYLTDFGLAKHTLSTSGATGPGHWVGTLDYAAPEQIRGERIDAAADVYALGGVLYSALTSEVPFPRESDEAKLWAHINDPPPKASALRPDVPRFLDAVVERALAKGPDERFPSAGELGRAAIAAAAGGSTSEQGWGRAAAGAAPADASTITSPAATATASLRHPGLPVSPNRTIGRVADVQAVAERLRASSVRLLTLTGPGGVGKTRLVLEVAHEVEADVRDGVRFVSLAAVQRPEDVSSAVAKALGIVVLAGESPAQAAERFLGTKQLLLVVDNFEHVLGAAPFIGDLLASCQVLRVMATSRVPLRLQAEECYRVAPLAVPEIASRDDPATVAAVGSVALFCERARARDPTYEMDDGNVAAVAEICRRVDGLPLGIELAAACCGLLSPAEIAERMATALARLGTPPRDVPARQQTLRATIDWSHELLDAAEKQCLRRFAVFVGGAGLDAVETIADTSLATLDRLVAASLIVRRRRAGAPTRLGMLETVRAYAAERLAAADDQRVVRQRHYRYYLELAQIHGTEPALCGLHGKEHLAVLDADTDNLHGALRWAIDDAGAEPALAMAVALGRYWVARNRYADAVTWIDRALSLPGADAHPALRARALRFKAWSLRWVGRAADQPAILSEAESIARRLDDPLILAQILGVRAGCAAIAGTPEIADSIADEALHFATIAGDEWEIANAWSTKAMAAATANELRERVERAASLLETVGNLEELGDLLGTAAYTALFVRSDDDAKAFLDRAIPIAREVGDAYQWMVIRGNFGLAALMTGDTEAAHDAFREELSLCRELVALPIACEGLIGLAGTAAARGDDHRAARLVGAASAHHHGSQQDVIEARLDAALLEAARARAGETAWRGAVQEGATLSFEDAIAYALDEALT